MEEDYVDAPTRPKRKRHFVGDHVDIPANLPHCYEKDGFGNVGIGKLISNIPAMNAEILEIQMMLQGGSGLEMGYIVIQDEDENHIIVLITEELMDANDALTQS